MPFIVIAFADDTIRDDESQLALISDSVVALHVASPRFRMYVC